MVCGPFGPCSYVVLQLCASILQIHYKLLDICCNFLVLYLLRLPVTYKAKIILTNNNVILPNWNVAKAGAQVKSWYLITSRCLGWWLCLAIILLPLRD